ncbi:mas-related G-protein coupled receptor member H-like, partial [Protobothrops mucrosquamatus]|uniref:mas-related G-protein coupled receptor member H-like n=1 Tax=Protobothrops mucrosquamatus TaxID=103944 RepID=UPI0010FAF461
LLIICSIGVPLNGIVIWLLGFQMKRNPFTVLILNLAIADFGFLILMTVYCIDDFIHILQSRILQKIFFSLSDVTYINGLFLLTAISIDRCVAVLFPIWHRCSRPKYLSPAVCIFLWIFSSLLTENLFDANELDFYLSPSASLNSSINPVIYFLVGRKKRPQSRESIKVIFQRVFREDEAPETR